MNDNSDSSTRKASEDLQLRLWDLRAAIRPASAVHGGI